MVINLVKGKVDKVGTQFRTSVLSYRSGEAPATLGEMLS